MAEKCDACGQTITEKTEKKKPVVRTKCHSCGQKPESLNLVVQALAVRDPSTDDDIWCLAEEQESPRVVKAVCGLCDGEFLAPDDYIDDRSFGIPTGLFLDDEFLEVVNGTAHWLDKQKSKKSKT